MALPTSRVRVAEWVSAPEAPVTVSVYAPSAAEAPMATLSVWLLPLPVKLFFESVGRPLTEKVTAEVKPPEGVAVTAKVVESPCWTLCDAGVTASAKSPAGGGVPIDRCETHLPSALLQVVCTR